MAPGQGAPSWLACKLPISTADAWSSTSGAGKAVRTEMSCSVPSCWKRVNEALAQAAEATDAIVLVVQLPAEVRLRLIGEDHAPFFRDHEEEEPVHQPQELPMEVDRRQRARLYTFDQAGVGRMSQESGAEFDQRPFNSIAQVVADAAALVDRDLEVLLQQAARGVFRALRQACPVTKTIENRELVESVLVEDAFQIELDVARLGA